MSSRIVARSLLAARPAARVAPSVSVAARAYASKPSPEDKAASILAAVPDNSILTKTGTVLAGTGVAAALISNEIYIVNDETVVLAASLILFTLIGKMASGPYTSWADKQIAHVKNTLVDARQRHYDAVKEKIDKIGQMNDSVELTQSLFALSKETAKLEAENFVLKQETALSAEAKAVLDSWVRFEQQQRESEQSDLVKTVQANVLKQLADPKFKKDLLSSAVADIEALVKNKAV